MSKIQTILQTLGIVLLLLFGSQNCVGQESEIPDTAAGARLAQMLEAMEVEGEKLEDFLKNAFEKQSDEDYQKRVGLSSQVSGQLGELTFDRVVRSTDTTISARCRSENGPVIQITIGVTEDAPHRIASIQLAMAGDDDGEEVDQSSLGQDERTSVIKTLIEELNTKYVFPKVAKQMAEDLQKSLDDRAYADVSGADEFAAKLTTQLRAICKDKHLRVRSGGIRRPASAVGRRPVDNHGFVKAEIIPGGIGYLKFNFFSGDPEAEKTAAAAMNFLANSEAIVFDLRHNGGGSPEMIAFLSGYIFDKSVHLNSFYNRPTDSTSESWSRDDVPGARFGQTKPVYVLTSNYTFSGAEEFSYNLKNLKRGTIVGETTGGGAHPVMPVRLSDRFSMSMPFARAINPITKTNWEGVGVKPHVEVAADDALDTAVELAKKAIKEKSEAKTETVDTGQMMNDAGRMMGSEDYAEAVVLLEQVVKSEPDNSMAWFRLGYCLHMDGQLDRAIKVHQKAAEFDTNTGLIAAYNLACAYSLKKETDLAFEALEKAIEKGFDDANQIEGDSDMDAIRDDARFKKLMDKIGG